MSQHTPPFDLGAPPADLPQGSTCLPDMQSLVQVDQPRLTQIHQGGLNTMTHEEFYAQQMRDGPYNTPGFAELKQDERDVVIAWWPLIWYKQSEYLDNKYVTTIAALLMHADLYRKDFVKKQRAANKQAALEKKDQGVERDAADEEYALRHLAWQTDCQARNKWINDKKAEWRKRVAEKAEAMIQWDVYVAQARSDYQEAAATPVPLRPQK